MKSTTVSWIFAAVFAGVVGLGAPNQGQAADPKGNFAVYGLGVQSCEALKAAADHDATITRRALSSWVMGYLSALNRLQADTFDVSPVSVGKALSEMVLAVCTTNLSARVEAVAFAVLRQLSVARQANESPLLEVRNGNVATAIRKDVLVSVQAELIKLKLLDGTADGAYGDKSRHAVEEFQKAQKLPVTGVPDAATIVRILVELPARAAVVQPAQTPPQRSSSRPARPQTR
jgi:peptidoglycan hydrolase-like protein with peptidoglycan-binding domain